MTFFIINVIFLILNSSVFLLAFSIHVTCCQKKDEKKCAVRPVTPSMRIAVASDEMGPDSVRTAVDERRRFEPESSEEPTLRPHKMKGDKGDKSQRVKSKKSQKKKKNQNKKSKEAEILKVASTQESLIGSGKKVKSMQTTQCSTNNVNSAKTGPQTAKTIPPSTALESTAGSNPGTIEVPTPSPGAPLPSGTSPQTEPAGTPVSPQPPEVVVKSAGIMSGAGLLPKGVKSTAVF